jgi:3-methyladenine DNA glycosylase/8-oxoguanine DNA glycosylase
MLDRVVHTATASFARADAALDDLVAQDRAVATRCRSALSRACGRCSTPDPLTALVRSISAQQINLRWAAVIRRRLARALRTPARRRRGAGVEPRRRVCSRPRSLMT